jgi:hypothetical protein
MRSNRHRLPWVIVAVVFFVILFGSGFFRPGVEATVTNKGTSPMKAVDIAVAGDRITIGDLLPGATRSVHVHPTSDSSILVIYQDNGDPRTVTVDCYMDSSSSGSIYIDIQDGVVIRKVNEIR